MKKELGEADIPVISVILVMRQLDAALDAGFSQSLEFKVPVLGPSREGFSFVGANDLITEAWGALKANPIVPRRQIQDRIGGGE